ncbi:MAG: 50S ribosomal protein L15 [Lentisphaeria bacterium]
MKLHELENKGRTATRKRVGRGNSSGKGHNCGTGENGAKSRSGYSRRLDFEGGQIPLIRRLPKRGFKNPNKCIYSVVNVGDIDEYFEEGDVVDSALLAAKGLIGKKLSTGIKVLGDGEVKKTLTIKADKFSAAAREKIEAAGGKAVNA